MYNLYLSRYSFQLFRAIKMDNKISNNPIKNLLLQYGVIYHPLEIYKIRKEAIFCNKNALKMT
jgi:hypothetical protein